MLYLVLGRFELILDRSSGGGTTTRLRQSPLGFFGVRAGVVRGPAGLEVGAGTNTGGGLGCRAGKGAALGAEGGALRFLVTGSLTILARGQLPSGGGVSEAGGRGAGWIGGA